MACVSFVCSCAAKLRRPRPVYYIFCSTIFIAGCCAMGNESLDDHQYSTNQPAPVLSLYRLMLFYAAEKSL